MLPETEDLLDHLADPAYRPAKLKEIAREFGVGGDDYRRLRDRMRDLEAEGRVTRVQKGRYVLPTALHRAWGRLRLHARGFGFVARAGAEADIFVAADALLDAGDGNWVEVEITEAGDGRQRLPRGRVVQIRQEPAREQVGTFRRRGRHGLVATDERLVSLETPPPQEVRDGDLVVVEIDGGDAPQGHGRILRVIGDPEDPRHDFDTVTLAHGIPVSDDPAALDEVRARVDRADVERTQELPRRRDLRELTVLTIDPDEARDFDDAVSLEALDSGLSRLGVHIADVAHYVPVGGAVDRQARDRGTSVYLLDRVVHMLPRDLAADLCTLAPHVERLAVSVFLDIDGAGRVQARSFCLSVIRSADRLTYGQVQAVLDGDGRGTGAAARHEGLLQEMAALSRALRERRRERGALDFDLPEARVEVGEDGVPTDLGRTAHLSSHRLIEEFMLAANEAVAEEAAAAALPVLYRIHDAPDPVKLELFRALAGSLGHRLPPARGVGSRHLQQALESLADQPDTALLSQLLLRAMMRARYATDEAEGHFGLASERYLHFTSPIRRYPDLVVHRALRAHLVGDDPTEEDLVWLAEWTSHTERRAEAAERDYTKLKQLRFMASRVGEEMDGVVSGVVGGGLFIELGDWLVEGFCPARLLEDDYFEFDETRHRLHGQRTGVVFTMGTPVRVRVLSVDPVMRRMDLLILEGGTTGRREAARGARGRGVRRASARDKRQSQRQQRPRGKGGGGRRGRKRPK
jgi:ribonuclease R